MPRNVNIPFSISSLKMTAEETRGHMREITSSPAERDDMSNPRRETARERGSMRRSQFSTHVLRLRQILQPYTHPPTLPLLQLTGKVAGQRSEFAFTHFQKAIPKTKGFPSPVYLFIFFCQLFLLLDVVGRSGLIRFASILCLPFADCPKTPSKRPTTSNELCLPFHPIHHPFLAGGSMLCSARFQCNYSARPLANIFHGQPVSFPSLSTTASQQITPHLPYRRCQRSRKGFSGIYCLFLLTSWPDRSHRLLFNFYYLKMQ